MVGRSALTQLLAMSVLGSGKKRYAYLTDPNTYKALLQCEDARRWFKACAEEIVSLEGNKTSEVVKEQQI